MKYHFKIVIWWLTITVIWGLFRLTNPEKLISELIAKPAIWLGITFLAFKINLLPKKIFIEFKKNYLSVKPFIKVFVIPAIFISIYFFLINFRVIEVPKVNTFGLITALLINFSTAFIEETVYRGILYTSLLRKNGEIESFLIVQLMFFVSHIPILVINFSSVHFLITKIVFILLIGSIHTIVFRLTKSLYSSTLTHGTWNTLARLFLM